MYGPEDETEEVDDGDGYKVTVRKDWFRPPKAKRCECQNISAPCNCGLGEKPQGVSARLYWDKVRASSNR